MQLMCFYGLNWAHHILRMSHDAACLVRRFTAFVDDGRMQIHNLHLSSSVHDSIQLNILFSFFLGLSLTQGPQSGRSRPLPSSKIPHFQNEAKYKTFLVKMHSYLHKNEHLTSFWYRGPGELGNGPLQNKSQFILSVVLSGYVTLIDIFPIN